jgi:hypothetical protein
MKVVAVVTDLLDRSKLPAGTSAVRRLPDDLAGIDVVVVDLSAPGAIDAVRAAAPVTRVVAYGRHTATDLLAAARDAGAHRVLARSAFFADPAAAIGP